MNRNRQCVSLRPAAPGPFTRRPRDAALLPLIRRRQRQLTGLSDAELRDRSWTARRCVTRNTIDAPETKVEAFALMAEALRRTVRIELYDVQLLAALVLARGAIAEMQTGEGKTFSCGPAAYLHGLLGRGVHIATPNAYLAERDHALLLPAFSLLGLTCGLLGQRSSAAEKRAAYQCDLTYGTGYEFGFDYLRDQLALRQQAQARLGDALLARLHGRQDNPHPRLQRGLAYCIVDEVDHVLLDEAGSPLILSAAAHGEAEDAELHRAAADLAAELREGEEYQRGSAGARLTPAGVARAHAPTREFPLHLLRRTWREYVEQALAARVMQRDVHYVVGGDQQVQIVDSSTGRIYDDRSWRNGLHQAVEAKEGLAITRETEILAQITRQRFARLYDRLAGMTGTASGCGREFRAAYQLDVCPIPLRRPSQRRLWPTRFFTCGELKWQAIVESVAEIHRLGRPVLVGTRSISDSRLLARAFEARQVQCQLLNGTQAAEEAAIVAQAGRSGAVTIATRLAGRGTDIKLSPWAERLGGLHVVVAECDPWERVDRQLIGRSARQGAPGSAQRFVAADDFLITAHGPWLGQVIQRLADPDGELRLNLMPQVARVQRAAERSASAARLALLRHDLARDSLFSRHSLEG